MLPGFPQDLDAAVNEVESEVRSASRRRSPDLFRGAVEAWCRLLEIPASAVECTPLFRERHLSHVRRVAAGLELTRAPPWSSRVWGVASALEERSREYHEVTDEALATMDHKDFLLIALGVAAAGYAAYSYSNRRGAMTASRASDLRAQPQRFVLVLVVNAKHSGLLETLHSGGLAALDDDRLYQATQALWFGTIADLKRSAISSWLSDDAQSADAPTEYDVHLVRVNVPQDDAGLRPSASQIDRLDAFRRLSAQNCSAQVSKRLPSDAYATPDLYAR